MDTLDGPLSEEERKVLGDLLGSPLKYPNRFKQWFIDYMAQNIPPLPIDHIQGYVKSRGYGAEATPGSLSSGGVWLDLGGPTFSDLPAGSYLMIWGFYAPNNVSSGTIYRMGPSIDGGNPSEDQACKVSAGSVGSTGARARVIEVAQGTDMVFKYRRDLWSGGPGANQAIPYSWATLLRV